MELVCAQNRFMTIKTVRNVEHGKSFVLIGCRSCNFKRVKSYGRLKKRKKATDRSLIRFDGIGEIFDLRETLEHADTVALDIKDIMIAEGINEDMGQKLVY